MKNILVVLAVLVASCRSAAPRRFAPAYNPEYMAADLRPVSGQQEIPEWEHASREAIRKALAKRINQISQK